MGEVVGDWVVKSGVVVTLLIKRYRLLESYVLVVVAPLAYQITEGRLFGAYVTLLMTFANDPPLSFSWMALIWPPVSKKSWIWELSGFVIVS